jgi:hypothetical protein
MSHENYLLRLCGLVVRVPGYRSRGPGSIPGATRFSGPEALIFLFPLAHVRDPVFSTVPSGTSNLYPALSVRDEINAHQN